MSVLRVRFINKYISIDSNYQAPARKQSVAQSQSNLPNMELPSEWRMFQIPVT